MNLGSWRYGGGVGSGNFPQKNSAQIGYMFFFEIFHLWVIFRHGASRGGGGGFRENPAAPDLWKPPKELKNYWKTIVIQTV